MTYQERIDDLYRRLGEFQNNPEFSKYKTVDQRMMFLFRQIVRLEMRNEEIVEKVNLLLDIQRKLDDTTKTI